MECGRQKLEQGSTSHREPVRDSGHSHSACPDSLWQSNKLSSVTNCPTTTFSHLYLNIWEMWRGLNSDLRKQEAFWPRQKLWQAPSSLPPSCTPSSISAATRAVVPKREEGVEEDEGRLDVGEVRLSAWLLHFRGFGGTMARLCGFELEKLLSLSGLLCSPSFVT